MNQRVKTLADEIRQLAPDEQADLMRRLRWVDLDEGEPDGTPDEIEQAWIEEVERRIDRADRGEDKSIPSEVVHAALRARIASS